MDAIIIVLLALVLCFVNGIEPEQEEVIELRETRLNPNFYRDENAFMEVAHVLGFMGSGDNSSSTNVSV